ncbi:DUF4352 domain-containing protein [Alkalihalophilus sp. As8PL]|uniref:DUF4352 domain-containing protein n=2 Tax=Alkalihalophilus TaxID=2893060 RepID=A0AB39BTQ5_9BACI|nr:DUF4352 domain-containing protein [Alkalihalophilus lindianensis]MDV2683918.1 DUF4352 domain-containing protein [Alkalihalophilus lindianensis]
MKGKFVLLAALLILLVLVGGYSFSSIPTSSLDGQESMGSVERGEQTKEINGLKMTVNNVRTEPIENNDNHYVIIDLTLENVGSNVQEFTLFKVTLVDSEGYAYSHSSRVETKGILGGQLHPERKNRGEIGFEVPVEQEYELVYTDHLRTGQVTWPITLDE